MSKLRWWQTAVVYEIVPQSFQDSNGDGSGDLQGIISRLDYLQWLGIDAIWLCPIYPSDFADFGYDIADYQNVHPLFGTLGDFDRLLAEAHRRGIRIILDFVPNHTSDRHPWFTQSRSSASDAKRDWYIWRKGGPLGPPNNWMSIFGGSAWELDATTGEYYLHTFTKQEPDLNWRNPEVEKAMLDTLRFWCARGVDGFRVDACWYLLKDELLRDNPPNPDWTQVRQHEQHSPCFSEDQPDVHRILKAFRSTIESCGPEHVLVGEMYLPPKQMVAYFGQDGDEVHLPSNFAVVEKKWTPETLAHVIAGYEGAMPRSAWPNWVLGNHDISRVATRLGPNLAANAAILLLTMRGTLFFYYGDEIGMQDVPEAAKVRPDPQISDFPAGNRLPYRSPMQWETGHTAGFSSGKPWLPVVKDPSRQNVAVQREDPGSLLNLYRRLIQLRRKEPALVSGAYIPLPLEDHLFAYLRNDAESSFLVILNFGDSTVSYSPRWGEVKGTVLAATDHKLEGHRVSKSVEIRGFGGMVIKREASSV